MNSAVTQLLIVQVGLLGTLSGELSYPRHSFAFVLAGLDFSLQHVRTIFLVDVQVVVHFTLDEIAHVLVDGLTAWCHKRRPQFNLGLTLENRLFHVDGYGRHKAVSNVGVLVVFVVKLFDSLGDMLLESTLMRTSLRSMLPVYKRVVFFSVLIGMRESNLDVIANHMNNRVQSVRCHVIVEQILQSVTAFDTPSIVHNGESGIQIGIVAQHGFHDIIVERVVLEQRVVGFKINIGTRFILRFIGLIGLELTFFKRDGTNIPLPVRLHLKMRTQSIHGFETHTVQSHTLLKRFRIVFSTCIKHAHRLY